MFNSIKRRPDHASLASTLSVVPSLPLFRWIARSRPNLHVQSKRVSVLGSPLTQSSTCADEAAIVFVGDDGRGVDLVAERRRQRVAFGAAKAADEENVVRRDTDGGGEKEEATQRGPQEATSIVMVWKEGKESKKSGGGGKTSLSLHFVLFSRRQ